jgi:hypothetical protein
MNRNIYYTALYNLGKDFDIYQKCYELSSKSVFNYLDFDEHILLSGKEENPFEMLRQIYYGIMSEVKKGNNVFHMEIDCVMVKPVTGIFDFLKMELFARTSPASIKWKGKWYDPYMNSGVKYFPATLPREIITKADEMILQYDESFWGYDQIVYNFMYYQQHERAYPIREELNYMPFKDVITHIKEEEAKIIHLFTTRGPKECYNKMVNYSKEN